ncbi:hypothetical protein KXX53_000473 [Aspergillus fumigatus]|nr:hypothetical protein KXX53_000473 [Aspergillus fumigatus]
MATTDPSDKLTKALALIDEAHAQDPRRISVANSGNGNDTIPYELHYTNKMTAYLHKRTANPSELLQLAIRAQHLKRWEVPRDSCPATKAGYYAWRNVFGGGVFGGRGGESGGIGAQGGSAEG